MHTIQEMLDIQEKQDFQNYSPRFDLNRMIPSGTARKDAVYYLVDCRSSKVMSLCGNVFKMFGRRNEEIHHVSDFYEMIDSNHYQDVVDTTALTLTWAIQLNKHLLPLRNQVTIEINYKRKGKTQFIQRDTMVAHVDANGTMTHTLGIFHPMSGTTGGKLKVVTGPYSEYVPYPEAIEFQPIFGRMEIMVLNHLAMGYSNRQIAEKMCLSVRTIETHRKNMLRKIEARNTPHLIYLGMQMGLL